MRIVVQRVKKASVIVDNVVINSIKQGYVLLVGFDKKDNREIVERLAEKIKNLRIFSDKEGKMNLSIEDTGGEILSVSQFTLYANLTTGRRPSFTQSASAEVAKLLYEYFNECLIKLELEVKTGIFQAEMLVNIENDGPVTVIFDSEDFV